MKPPTRAIDAAWIALFILALGFVSWRTFTRLRPLDNPRDANDSGLGDFQDVVYYPARAAMAGVNPYDVRPAAEGGAYFEKFPAGNPFPVYAPLIFIASVPFAILPLVPGEILYWLANVGLLLAYSYALLCVGKLNGSIAAVCAVASALLLSRAGHANLYFGNVALPMALATLGGWWFADRRPWLAALCTTAALIKPTFGGPLVVLLLIRGSYRAALGGLLIATLANLAVVAAFLPQELTNPRALEILVNNQLATENDPAVDSLNSASRVDLVLVVERTAGRHLPLPVRVALIFSVLAIAGWRCRALARQSGPDDHDCRLLATAVASLATVLCIYHNVYDALFVAPAAVAAWRFAAAKDSGTRRVGRTVFLLTLIPGLNYTSSKQFVELLAAWLPSFAGLITTSAVWTLLCIVSGACLTVGWILLLTLNSASEKTPTRSVSEGIDEPAVEHPVPR